MQLSEYLFAVEGEVFSFYLAKFGKKKVSAPLWFRKDEVKFSNPRVYVRGQAIADCRPDGKILPGFKCAMRPGVRIEVKKLPDNLSTFVLVKN